MILRNNATGLILSIFLISFGCQSVDTETMQPNEFAKKVSEIIVKETKFDFEPAIQKFEQDGVYLYDFPSQEEGIFLARSVVSVRDVEGNDFTAYLAVNQQAGSLSVFLNGTQVYENTVTKDEYLNHVDYGLFEFQNKIPIDITDGNHQLVVKYKPLKKGNNRVYLSFIRSDNALPYPGIEVKSPSNKEVFDHYGYWWIGPLKEGINLKDLIANDVSENQLISQTAKSVFGKTIRWDIPTLHLVKSLPGWLTFQNWHYSGGTFLDAMRQVGEQFPNQNYSSYINNHTNFLEDNIDEIEQMRKDYGLIEGPFGHYFRASLLDDMGMQTVPYINKIIEMSPQDRDKSLFEYKLTNRVVDHIMNNASRLPDGTFARFTPDTMSVWADDLFMGSIVLLKMSELTGNEEYLNEVVKQVIQFDDYLLDSADNLYWHGWFSRNREHSSTKWGRANGWTMMTKTELLKAMPKNHPKRQEVLEIFKRHAQGLKEVQSSDGRWHQVLDDPNTYLETSATAMFVRAFAAGINEGWLSREEFESSVELGWKALTNQFDENGDVIGIVRGTPIMFSDEEYDNWGTRRNDPRGLGALLYAAIEVDKMINSSK
tara:strand:+ start:54946 stop:56739 length:1794 start_codon:yes stop_codon:yes gene_type:complete